MKHDSLLREIIDWLVHIALAVVVTVIIINYIGQFTIVKGNSMLPTLKDSSILIIEKLTQRFGHIKQGDIVVVKIPELLGNGKTYAVKRVIATEGQKVTIENGEVFVDSKKLDEQYTSDGDTLITEGLYNDITVSEACIYVLGDNRLPRASRDSRTFGPISINKIAGRVVFRLFPFNEIGVVK